MKIVNKTIKLQSKAGVQILDLTPKIECILASTNIANGSMLVFTKHTTSAVRINENEKRLLEDIKQHLEKMEMCMNSSMTQPKILSS